ncbi:ribonuclease R [Ligilactobacillus equi]|uniref:Ribonuclease R n=1 Tax=Ligilactobacillus equi DSM 15833 = JCM 10991 TaxID=1423740 RepID=A0A0R1TUY5_9LACO|nr:ribonuclease R [Ligilactobacillus equi]KRL85005.1 ribonuclease R 1 [Ligilactobacillus equi DSM 15833 = JCM 10991]
MQNDELKAAILAHLGEQPDQEFTVNQLVDLLDMQKSGQFKFVVKALAELEHDHQINLNQSGAFTLARRKEAQVFTGIFHGNDRGFGFVTIDPEQPDFFINPTQTMAALNGDEVEVEMLSAGDPENGKGPEGKIVAITQHNLTQVVGAFEVPEDEKLPAGIIGIIKLKDKKLANYRFLIEDTGLHPVPGEVILADITAYPDSHLPGILKGVATKVIGNVNDPGIDILEIVYQHNLPTEFPQEVQDQIAQIPDYVTEAEKVGRRDLTDQKLVTIDSIESKDLDDAVTVWKLENGNYHLGVHIADVSHYVRPGTPLDDEAYDRGTSVYLTDRVIPMLPPKLSNGICSLNPKVERLAMSCEMEITSEGEVVNHEIFPSVIKTTERMTYIDINKILESDDEKTKERYAELVPMFKEMAELHKILVKMRKRRGSIDFEFPEAKIIVDEEGHPTDIQIRERGTSERMVESFMLAANETVATHYNQAHLPFVYRIHEDPKEDKIKAFYEMLEGLGVQVTGRSDKITPKMLQTVLKKVAGSPEEAMVSTMMLRSMQQAKYAPTPVGHFSLAAGDYTHFTSPIRRYPDLMVHRLIRTYATDRSQDTQDRIESQLPEMTTHASEMERRAIDTERDTDAMKKAEYMADHVGEEFDAVVSSVTKFGMFIALENTVEGLIHISELKDDFYYFVEKQLALVGQRSKRTFRIGQAIRVKLDSVNVEQKEINFKLLNPKDAPTSNLLDGIELPPRQRRNDRNHDRRGDKRQRNGRNRSGKGNNRRYNDRHSDHRLNDRNRNNRGNKPRFSRNRNNTKK